MINFYKSRLLSDYSLIQQLEKQFANYTGFKYGIAVDSCTNALKLCLEWEKPKTVSIPTMTFASVAHEVIHCGAKLTLDARYMVGWGYQLIGTHIYDSAHEIMKDTPHEKEDKYCYSFYPTKLCPSYEGGMICTDDLEFAEWARVARQCGRTGYGHSYDVPIIGHKCNMTPMQAKEALKSLKILDKIKKKQKKQRDSYNEYFEAWRDTDHLYVIRVKNRDEFLKFMLDGGVQCSVHFKPIHMLTAYQKYKPKNVKQIEELYSEIVSLPLHPYLNAVQQSRIIALVKHWQSVQN